MSTTLQIDDLRTDGGMQPRAEIDYRTVREYREAMERGVEFPPVNVVFDGDEYWLYDGFHRVQAAQRAGRDEVEAEVEQGTREEAVWKSLAANKGHGLRRSQADKRRAIKKALEGWGTDKSDREIARHIGCSPTTVGKYREEMESLSNLDSQPERTGADGRTIDTSNIGGSGRQEESELQPEGGTEGSTYEETYGGDGAPPDTRGLEDERLGRGGSGEHGAGDEYVTAEEAVTTICSSVTMMLSEQSRTAVGLRELRQMWEENKLTDEQVDRICEKLRGLRGRVEVFEERFGDSVEAGNPEMEIEAGVDKAGMSRSSVTDSG